jgi:carotenoid cleavage dioxygenase
MSIDVDPTATPAPGASPDPFLAGGWEPVHDELVTDDLAVTGALPAGLSGAYLRNGPNPAFAPLGAYHLFDGDGMVHAVEIQDGRARYRNRWVRSKGLEAERRAGHALFGGLSDFRMPPEDVMAEAGPMKNTANTHVWRHAGRIFALMEAGRPTEITPELETLGEYTFDDRLQGPMTAHPKTDPETGELLFFGYSPFPPFVRLHVADAAGRLVTSVPVDLPAAVMMHDFAVSRDRVVFFDLPALFDVQALLSGGSGIRWEPSNGARIGVLDRADLHAPVRWFDMDPFWMFHVLNAYDDGDAVVVEGCRAPRLNVAFGDEELGEPVRPMLHRWRIDLAVGRVTEEALDDRAGDFPRLNDDHAGLPARYGYVANPRSWGETKVAFEGVVKHDLVAGTSVVHSYGPTAVAGEAAFAPDPDRSTEDGGWLLNFVYDEADGTSALVVVDAEAMEEVARVHLPRRVPLGFHGNWLAAGAQGNNHHPGA